MLGSKDTKKRKLIRWGELANVDTTLREGTTNHRKGKIKDAEKGPALREPKT